MRTCADCQATFKVNYLYLIRPPVYPGQVDRSTDEFWLCAPCWDRLVGAATLGAIR